MIHHRPQTLDHCPPRDGVLINSATIDGGLMLMVILASGRVEDAGRQSFSLNAFIRIDGDGQVFVSLPYVKGEQDSFTSIRRLVAEELEVTLSRVHLEQKLSLLAETENCDTVRDAWRLLREAVATARTMLIAAAAKRWDVATWSCHAYEGEVIHTASRRKLRYGEVVAEAARIPPPINVALRQRAARALSWPYGSSVGKVVSATSEHRQLIMNRPHQLDLADYRVILPEDIDWKPFPAFPPGARLAVVVGHPAEPGPYVIRVKAPGDTKLMPHKHPEDRLYTVMSGVFYIGLGKTFDGDRVKAYPPGSVIVLPGETWHFHWAKSGEYVTQISGFGPLGLEYHNPHDDPRHQHT